MSLVDEMFDRRWLSNSGPLVEQFEQRLASFLGVKHCLAMVNGTIGLEVAIRALGLGGEVILPSYTFIATAHALRWQGITPVFADVDPKTHNISPQSVRSLIGPKTSGILGVHLWGRPAPVEELSSIAEEFDLKLMFDAAHAFGNTHRGARIGSFGEAEVFSFHATKFFNTFEGGAVVTNNGELAERMRLLRNFGFVDYDCVTHLGTNAKMPEIAGAMGIVNMDSIEGFVEHNQANYEAYADVISSCGDIDLISYDSVEWNNFQYIVVELSSRFAAHRDDIVAELHKQNVIARRYFWPGCHLMAPYVGMPETSRTSLAGTSRVAERVIVLPTGTAMTPETCAAVAGLLCEIIETRLPIP